MGAHCFERSTVSRGRRPGRPAIKRVARSWRRIISVRLSGELAGWHGTPHVVIGIGTAGGGGGRLRPPRPLALGGGDVRGAGDGGGGGGGHLHQLLDPDARVHLRPRRLESAHLEEHAAERPHVGAAVVGLALAQCLLSRSIKDQEISSKGLTATVKQARDIAVSLIRLGSLGDSLEKACDLIETALEKENRSGAPFVDIKDPSSLLAKVSAWRARSYSTTKDVGDLIDFPSLVLGEAVSRVCSMDPGQSKSRLFIDLHTALRKAASRMESEKIPTLAHVSAALKCRLASLRLGKISLLKELQGKMFEEVSHAVKNLFIRVERPPRKEM